MHSFGDIIFNVLLRHITRKHQKKKRNYFLQKLAETLKGLHTELQERTVALIQEPKN
jgi:hypothetical protein